MNWEDYECQGQMTIFDFIQDPTSGVGRTSQEHCRATKERTSEKSLKKSLKSSKPMFIYLCRGGANGQMPDCWTETDIQSLGVSETRLTRECHRDAEESFLWQILEEEVPQKYFLSNRACLGILRRSEKRGKPLPQVLKNALMKQGGISEQELATLNVTEG